MNEIRMEEISLSFGDKKVLDRFSASFPLGQATCIMCSSGCGKTTLLRILLGLQRPDSGRIIGRPERMGAVFQEDRLLEGFSSLANIRLVTGRKVPRHIIQAHLTELGLGDCVRDPVSTLSGGMQRRVAIARAVLYDPALLVLDEAFKGLDADTRLRAMEYVRAHSQGRTLVTVTHDPQEAAFWGGEPIHMATMGE